MAAKKQKPKRASFLRNLLINQKSVVMLFVCIFAVVGAAYLLRSKASPIIKAQIAGVIDRQGMPPASYQSVVDSYVVKLDWAEIQPNSASDFNTSKIDTEIQNAKAKNMHLKLRIYTGSGSPDWVKNLPVTTGTQGPVHICDPNAVPVVCGDIPHFWEKNVQDAYAALQTKLAAKYDAVEGDASVVQEVVIGGCTTIFQEPLIRQRGTDNITAFQTAGYTEAANWACEQAQFQAHMVWAHTRSSIALNPYDEWTGSGFKVNPAKTEQLIDYCRSVLGERCVLGNNSVGKKTTMDVDQACDVIGGSSWATLAPYSRLYTYIKCKGAPIYFQTEFADRISQNGYTLPQVIDYATSLGAGMVELPSGYANTTMTGIYIAPADMVTYDAKLNDRALHMTGGDPDLVITSIGMDPQQPTEGNQVIFKAVIENKGSVATPAGTQHDVVFQIDGATVAWSNSFTGPLEPGTSVTVMANGGPQGVIYWQATAGNHQLTAIIDNRNIIVESDETNNIFSQSVNVNALTPPPPPATDTTPPSAPSNLKVTSSDRRSVSLSWTPSTDNVGVTGYYIYRSGTADPIAFVTGTSYTDRAVTPNKTYTYKVTAVDAGYNESAASNTVQVSTRR